MNNILIFVSYDANPEARLKEALSSYNMLPNMEYVFLADTKNHVVLEYALNSNTRIEHQTPRINSEWEFTGYKMAFDLAKTRIQSENSYAAYFLNDTLVKHGRLRKSERIALIEYAAKRLVEEPMLVGFFHKTTLLPNRPPYANTKFFAVLNVKFSDVDEAFKIGKILVQYENDAYANNVFRGSDFQKFLSKWLNGTKQEEKGKSCQTWYKSQPINSKNKIFFENKARSIIHEHLFTDILLSKGVLDYCLMKNSFAIRIISKLTRFKY